MTCHTITPMLAAIMTKNTTCIHGAMLPKTSRVALFMAEGDGILA